MPVSAFHMFLLPSPRGPGVQSHTYLAAPGRGLAAVAEASASTTSWGFAVKCAETAVRAVKARDRVSLGSDLPPRRTEDSPESLLASFQAANDLLYRAHQAEAPIIAPTSLAAALVTPQGAFVAWTGSAVSAYRVGRDRVEAIATPPPSPADGQEWKAFLERVGDYASYVGYLGERPYPGPQIKTAEIAAEPGDLLLLAPGGSSYRRERSQLLELLAAHRDALEPAFAEALAREDLASVLPAPLLRFYG